MTPDFKKNYNNNFVYIFFKFDSGKELILNQGEVYN